MLAKNHGVMPTIKQADPLAAYLAHREEIDAAVARVMESGSYLVGRELERFEGCFASFCDARHAVGVANGTDAVELALRSIGVANNDFVLTTALTAVASATGIVRTGASPIFVDISASTCCMSPESLERTIEHCYLSGRIPKAILLVHLYGQPASPSHVLQIAQRFGLRVVEDCAQAHGAKEGHGKVSSFGEVAAFSFYPTKNLGTLGDAGAVVTSDDKIASRLREMRQYGWNEVRSSTCYGVNSRMDEIHAAILNVKMNYLETSTARRNEIALRYDEAFDGNQVLRPLYKQPGHAHAYHQYVLRVKNRNEIQEALNKKNVATAVHYNLPVHKHPFFAQYRALALDLSEAENASREVLSLPMYPELTDADVAHIIAACLSCATV